MSLWPSAIFLYIAALGKGRSRGVQQPLHNGEAREGEELNDGEERVGVVALDASVEHSIGDSAPFHPACSLDSLQRTYPWTAWSRDGSSLACVMAASSVRSLLSKLLICTKYSTRWSVLSRHGPKFGPARLPGSSRMVSGVGAGLGAGVGAVTSRTARGSVYAHAGGISQSVPASPRACRFSPPTDGTDCTLRYGHRLMPFARQIFLSDVRHMPRCFATAFSGILKYLDSSCIESSMTLCVRIATLAPSLLPGDAHHTCPPCR
jgi:hypothetical protein